MLLDLNKDTKLCISVSARPGNFGTRFQNFLYRELGLNFVYKAFAAEDIQGVITGIRALGIRGCAVSMPFKESCIEYLDELDSSARGIESVNTIVNDQGHLKAYNTDYSAVFQLLKSYQISTDTEFAVLGSGGMAKAVVCALRDSGFSHGFVIARNERTGSILASRYGYNWRLEMGDARPGLLINASPIGMAGGKEAQDLAFSYESVARARTVFYVVAVPVDTPLLTLAKSLDKKVISGAEVIVLQAVEQFVLYTGIRPKPELIKQAADHAFSTEQ